MTADEEGKLTTSPWSHPVTSSATVVRAGALTVFEDLGRKGYAHLGVPRSGALDPAAHALANRLVGNQEEAATLETTFDGVALRFESSATVAVTGASAPVSINGRPAAWSLPIHLRRGALLDVGHATAGVRSYVAVCGGFDVPRLLGSRSTDMLSKLGPPPLTVGASVPIGPPAGKPGALDMAPYPIPRDSERLTVYRGPRWDWLTDEAAEAFFSQDYAVSPLSNRIGLRLSGQPLGAKRKDELPSEGLVWGAIQLLPDGQPVIVLADHPTTGGYPVVGVVDRSCATACAQARPGSALHFTERRAVVEPSHLSTGTERGNSSEA